MALTKQKKNQVVDEVRQLLEQSKMTVVAKYSGTSVKAMQDLRRQASQSSTVVKVVKNRLVIKAIGDIDKFKSADLSVLNGQLMYVFNSEDEVSPAQTLAGFAKNNPNVEFIGAYTFDGNFIGPDDVKSLASLPSKDQLQAILVGTVSAPLSGFVNVLAGNVRGVLNVLSARSEQISDS